MTVDEARIEKAQNLMKSFLESVEKQIDDDVNVPELLIIAARTLRHTAMILLVRGVGDVQAAEVTQEILRLGGLEVLLDMRQAVGARLSAAEMSAAHDS